MLMIPFLHHAIGVDNFLYAGNFINAPIVSYKVSKNSCSIIVCECMNYWTIILTSIVGLALMLK